MSERYRKVWYFGVRLYELKAPTQTNPIAIYACRNNVLPLGIPAYNLGDGWVSFEVEVSVDTPSDVNPPASSSTASA